MGCEYQTDEIYNRKVNPDVSPPDIQVIDLNIISDTLYVYGSVTIRFKFTAGNLEVKKVSLLIDGEEKGVVFSDGGSFNLSLSNQRPGIHDLSVRIYTTTGSGSLAEEFDAESYTENRTWKLVYLPQGYNLEISSSTEDGLLHLHWNRYLSSDLKEYIVYKRNSSFAYSEIYRTRLNEYIDSAYVGEDAEYAIKVVTDDNPEYAQNWFRINSDVIQMSLNMNSSGQYIVNWTKPRYYNAIDTIILWQGLADNSNSVHRAMTTTNPNDTVFKVLSGKFGDKMSFYIRLVPHNSAFENSPQGNLLGHITGYLGFSYDKDENWTLLPADNDGFIYFDCFKINRYSLSQLKLISELKYQIKNCSGCLSSAVSSSNTGKYLSNFVYCDETLLFSNTEDLSTYSLHNINNITGPSYHSLSLADNGTALFHSSQGGYDLYNLVSSSRIGHYNSDYDYQTVQRIAPDGSYFTICTDSLKMIKVSDSSFSEMWKIKYLKDYLRFYEFNPFNPDEIYFWEGSRLEVRSCNDLSVISSIHLSDLYLLNIDYKNNEFLSYNSGHLLVRSLNDGSVKYDIPVNFDPHYWYFACILVNHTIVSAKGVMYFLQ